MVPTPTARPRSGKGGRFDPAWIYGERVSESTANHYLRDLGPLLMDMA